MGFFDKTLILADGLALPTVGIVGQSGDVIDLGPEGLGVSVNARTTTRAAAYDGMYLVVNCTETFTDDGTNVAPIFMFGVGTFPTLGTVAANAAAAFASPCKLFQYGNVDHLNLFQNGVAAAIAGKQIVVGRFNFTPQVEVDRFMAFYIYLCGATTADVVPAAGPYSVPTAGKLTAYLTTVAPTSKLYSKDLLN